MNHLRDDTESDLHFTDVAKARAELSRLLRDFLDTSLAWRAREGGVAPALAAAVTPGLGKTSTMLRLLADVAPAFLREGHVAVYVPTLDLADRAYADFSRLAPGVPARVLRGRDSTHPSTGVRMCERPEIARRIAPVVRSVTQTICEPAEGRRAPCAIACPYLDQRPDEPCVLFLAHSYLTTKLPVAGSVVLRIVDEKVWPALIRVRDVTLEDWLQPPAPGLSATLEALHEEARFGAVRALQAGGALHDILRAEGLTEDILGSLRAHEYESAPTLDLRPDMPRDVTKSRVEAFDFGLWASRSGRAQVFEYLAESIRAGRSERLSLSARPSGDGTRQVLRLHTMDQLSDDIPTLFLDADADPAILEQIRPGTRHVRVTVAPKATVVQAVDRTLSNAWLLDDRRGAERQDLVLDIVRREVARAGGGKVLLVATTAVLRALHLRATGTEPQSIEALLAPILGANPRWFGPRLQGVNDYEDFDTIVVVGRLQPPTGEVEKCARCLFGEAEPPLEFVDGSAFPQQQVRRVMTDGSRGVVKISDHPDGRISAVLRQFRECASLQAIARLRLVAPRKPKRVVVLGSLVLPGLAVDHATTLEALAEGLCQSRSKMGQFPGAIVPG